MINAGTFEFGGKFWIGDYGTGSVTLNGGTLNQASGGSIATWRFGHFKANGVPDSTQNGDGDGTLEITGGTAIALNRVIFGERGTGALIMSGGSLTAGDDVEFSALGGTSTLTMTGGTITTTGKFQMADGSGGTGDFIMSDGSITAGDDVEFSFAGGTSSLTMTGGTITTTGKFQMADGSGGTGAFIMSDGILTAGDNVEFSDGGGTSTLVMTGGTITTTGKINMAGGTGDPNFIGTVTNATINSVGQTNLGLAGYAELTLGTGAVFNNGGRDIYVGSERGVSVVTLNILGADVDVGDFRLGGQFIDSNSIATLNMDGGTLTISGVENDFDIGRNSGNAGIVTTFNLASGTIVVADDMQIADNNNGNAYINISGGVIDIGGDLEIAENGYVEFDMTGGEINIVDELQIAKRGYAEFNMTGGTVNVGTDMFVPQSSQDSIAMITVSNTAVLNVGDDLKLNRGNPGLLTVDGGGTINVVDLFRVGNGSDDTEFTVNVKEGTVTCGTFKVGSGDTDVDIIIGSDSTDSDPNISDATFGQAVVDCNTLDLSDLNDQGSDLNMIKLRPGGILIVDNIPATSDPNIIFDCQQEEPISPTDPNLICVVPYTIELLIAEGYITIDGDLFDLPDTVIDGRNGSEWLVAGEAWGIIQEDDYQPGRTAFYVGAVVAPVAPPECITPPAGDRTDDCICNMDDLVDFVGGGTWAVSEGLIEFAEISETWLECGLDKDCPGGTTPTEY